MNSPGGLLLPLLLALTLLDGCTVTTEREGDPHYVTQARDAQFEVGKTTTLEVAQAFGPPDEIVPRGEELWFLYRFRDRRTSRLVVSYYLNWFQRHTVHEIDSQLIVAFDGQDRFLYVGMSDIPSEGAFMRHFR
ncbi:MAG TPA: hypothetical protein DEA08_26680 [Planctomycetes bacterium]|nr:hypothetical protein [Planctomycetota bacterium]